MIIGTTYRSACEAPLRRSARLGRVITMTIDAKVRAQPGSWGFFAFGAGCFYAAKKLGLPPWLSKMAVAAVTVTWFIWIRGLISGDMSGRRIYGKRL